MASYRIRFFLFHKVTRLYIFKSLLFLTQFPFLSLFFSIQLILSLVSHDLIIGKETIPLLTPAGNGIRSVSCLGLSNYFWSDFFHALNTRCFTFSISIEFSSFYSLICSLSFHSTVRIAEYDHHSALSPSLLSSTLSSLPPSPSPLLKSKL